jgi:uncharacterized protein (TIGR02217 family)
MATFPTSPQPLKLYRKQIQFSTNIVVFENGVEQRSQTWPTGKQGFTLQYDVLTQAEMQTLWDFYVARGGAYESFYFLDWVSNITYTVRFSNDQLTMEQFFNRIFRGNLELIQVF